MQNKKIIAILGLPGSGKTIAVNYIIEKTNWPKVYFGEVIFDEMKKKNLKITQKNEKMIREELRKKFGMDVCAKKSLPKIKKNLKKSNVVIIESLYSWEEYISLKKKFADNLITIVVYAPPKERYERLKKRYKRPLTPREAQKRDYAQIENSHQAGPIAMADYTIINNGTTRDLYIQIDKIICEGK